MAEAVSSNLERYNRAMGEYLRYSSTKLPADICRKKAQSLAFALFTAAKETAPQRANIEAQADVILKRIEKALHARGIRLTRVQLLALVRKELDRRIQAVRFVATGYLPAVQATRARVNAGNLPAVAEPQGDYLDRSNDAAPVITIINSTPGVVADNERNRFVDVALGRESNDVEPYILRKKREAVQSFLKSF